jgi:hypothetical protein
VHAARRAQTPRTFVNIFFLCKKELSSFYEKKKFFILIISVKSTQLIKEKGLVFPVNPVHISEVPLRAGLSPIHITNGAQKQASTHSFSRHYKQLYTNIGGSKIQIRVKFRNLKLVLLRVYLFLYFQNIIFYFK